MHLSISILASKITDGKNVTETTASDCSNMGLTGLDDLAMAKNLRKLNLSKNKLKNIQIIAHNTLVTMLNLAHNRIATMDGISVLQKLLVLNLSHNEIIAMERLANNPVLKALILNDNQITHIANVNATLTDLVLSRNKIIAFGDFLTHAHLNKLALSHNNISIIPSNLDMPVLKQLALNNNKISSIPASLPASLEILDLGNNSITDITPLFAMVKLTNLNLKGNPILDYKDTLLSKLPLLRVLDGERLDEGFHERRLKIATDRAAQMDKIVGILAKEIRLQKKAVKAGADRKRLDALLIEMDEIKALDSVKGKKKDVDSGKVVDDSGMLDADAPALIPAEISTLRANDLKRIREAGPVLDADIPLAASKAQSSPTMSKQHSQEGPTGVSKAKHTGLLKVVEPKRKKIKGAQAFNPEAIESAETIVSGWD